jgi:cytochrome c-L
MRHPMLVALAGLAALSAHAQQQPAPEAKPAADPAAQPAAAPAADGPLEFRTVVGDKPIEIPADEATPAFEQFRETGENPFAGDEAALAEGKKLYAKLCQACHLPGGEGRIGPSLRDDLWRHPRLETEAGRFEIIHSGGAGAMQAFHPRMRLDEILKVMAWIDTFRAS